MNTASQTIEKTGIRTKAMERRLLSVEQLPETETSEILALPAENIGYEDAEMKDANLKDEALLN